MGRSEPTRVHGARRLSGSGRASPATSRAAYTTGVPVVYAAV
ncbi:hypothetical protein F750_0408 [Streptomyces sp. PAMC 26508]|nr:hypothetical protein F750_0408 [Streptomyces sp. PAMC 26508]